jgi:hypothetical protein
MKNIMKSFFTFVLKKPMLDYNKKPWYSWGKFNLWCFL